MGGKRAKPLRSTMRSGGSGLSTPHEQSGCARNVVHLATLEVACHFPPDQLPAAAAAAKEKSAELSSEGQDVQYIRSTFVPEGARCYCLFEGSSREAVEEVQRRANLPYEKIHDAAFLTADEV